VDCVIVFGLVLRSVSFRACLINHKVVKGLCHCVFDSAFHIGSVGEVLVVALIFGGALSFYLHIYIHTYILHTSVFSHLVSDFPSASPLELLFFLSLSSISLDRLISSFLSPVVVAVAVAVAVLVVVVLVVAIAVAAVSVPKVPNHYTSPLRP